MTLFESIDADGIPLPHQPLAEVTSLEHPQVIDCLVAYAAAIEDGSRPDRDAVLREFPQLADQLAGCLETIELICLNGQIWASLANVDHPDDKQMSDVPISGAHDGNLF